MSNQRTIEMHWVCSACSTRNLGRFKECQHCGDPKQANEPWRMPDAATAESVRDPAVLAQAKAGADWACHYCTAYNARTQRECVQCGSPRDEGKRVTETRARELGRPVASTRRPLRAWAIGGVATAVLLACGGLGALGLGAGALRSRPGVSKIDVRVADVTGVRWRHEVVVERHRVVEEEGFVEARPAEAFDVRSLGDRHHHDEQVLDHMTTETYVEQVPYEELESYQDQEQCGEDCTDIPETCTESCTPDENGFATCTTSCSGGGRSCTPRYCSVSKTRTVTRHRPENRTREVPVYRSEPRYAEFFHWSVWRWTVDRTIVAEGGEGDPLRWPAEAELAPPSPLGEGESERSRRSARYEVLLSAAGEPDRRLSLRNSEDLAAYPVGSCWKFAGSGPDPVGRCF
jgi:hypothetical protein